MKAYNKKKKPKHYTKARYKIIDRGIRKSILCTSKDMKRYFTLPIEKIKFKYVIIISFKSVKKSKGEINAEVKKAIQSKKVERYRKS